MDSIRGMTKIKTVIAQMEVIPARPDLNYNKMCQIISDAKNEKADLVIFPELCISGYLIGDMWEETSFIYDCINYGELVRELSTGITIVFGNVAYNGGNGNDGRLSKVNALFVAQDCQWKPMVKGLNINYQPKALLPNYREFEEARYFTSFVELANNVYNIDIKDLYNLVDIKGYKVGFTICEDGWDQDYQVKPMKILTDLGAELLINISCSPFTQGKNNSRDRVFGHHSFEKVPVIYCNAVGLQNNGKTIYAFDGNSALYGTFGYNILEHSSFEEKFHVVEFPSEDYYGKENKAKYNTIRNKNIDGIEEIYNALKYGIKQYSRQSGIDRVVIGISGGVDSAVAAALYVDALGPDNVMLVNMPSRFNSETTKTIASQIANNLGCYYTVIPIENSVNLTKNQVNSALITGGPSEVKLELSDFNMENVQSRDRSSRILAAVASAWNGVFTNNGNKTEATVGYCTIYGDTCGFLAALGDVWKLDIYNLATYINSNNATNIIPPKVFEIVASAELSDNQSVDDGEGDPLIYWYHDALFRSWIEYWNRANITDIAIWYSEGILEEKLGLDKKITDIFSTPQEFFNDLERWWKLFRGMGIAKRIQSPPVLAVSRRAFGFDYRESLNSGYIGRKYYEIKSDFLSK